MTARATTGGSRVSAGRAVRQLHPAYFAVVMSTGIVSIAFDNLGVHPVALGLAVVNLATFGVLVVLYAVRLLVYTEAVAADLRDRGRRWGFLSFTVGTNVVGTQLIIFFNRPVAAAVLWLAMAFATPVLLYYIYVTAFLGRQQVADIGERIDGTFLLTTVSMQSLAVLAVRLAAEFPGHDSVLVLTALAYWAAGFVLYVLVLTLVVYRLFSTSLEPAEWTGPYWICMGAAAITTLAGTMVSSELRAFPQWQPYIPSILLVSFLAWAVGTWWIPVLLAADWWKFTNLDVDGVTPLWIVLFPWARLGLGGDAHFYEPESWGRMFPMGMYTACTLNLTGVQTFDLLVIIPRYWAWFALVVWGFTFLGTLRAVERTIRTTGPE